MPGDQEHRVDVSGGGRLRTSDTWHAEEAGRDDRPHKHQGQPGATEGLKWWGGVTNSALWKDLSDSLAKSSCRELGEAARVWEGQAPRHNLVVAWTAVCGGGERERERWAERGDGLGVGGEHQGGVKDDLWVVALHM